MRGSRMIADVLGTRLKARPFGALLLLIIRRLNGALAKLQAAYGM